MPDESDSPEPFRPKSYRRVRITGVDVIDRAVSLFRRSQHLIERSTRLVDESWERLRDTDGSDPRKEP